MAPSSQQIRFAEKLKSFLDKTKEHIEEVSPGGYYDEIWLRDASYILKDQFLSGGATSTQKILQTLFVIWSYQITTNSKFKLVRGRGSPEMGFKQKRVDRRIRSKFEGALPTTIVHDRGLCEIYANNPDIDSTALMISTTSWILNSLLKLGLPSSAEPTTITADSINNNKTVILSTTSTQMALDFTVPKMKKAIAYLLSRDADSDGLLEQDHNEDWMDTVMRKGKIVYSQACFILALKNFSLLLSELGKNRESQKMMNLADKNIRAVEDNLWSEEDNSYIDVQQEEKHIGGPYRTLTQDACMYLIAVKEGPSSIKTQKFHQRAASTLDAIRDRIWKERWPLVTEVELKKTGPWKIKPNQYHNHTFWPWSTAIEMQARSRFNQFKECEMLFSKVASDNHPHEHIFYEWINPVNDKLQGAYPFRTGLSAVRLAAREIIGRVMGRKVVS